MSGESEIDGELRVLADENRRLVLNYLGEHSDNRASVDELTRLLARRSPRAEERNQESTAFRTHLHHHHLPRLEDCGLVEYDRRSGVVRYHPNQRIERLLRHIATVEATTMGVREQYD